MEADVKIFIPVGGTLQTNIGIVEAVEDTELECEKCVFRKDYTICDNFPCLADNREDNTNIFFKLKQNEQETAKEAAGK